MKKITDAQIKKIRRKLFSSNPSKELCNKINIDEQLINSVLFGDVRKVNEYTYNKLMCFMDPTQINIKKYQKIYITIPGTNTNIHTSILKEKSLKNFKRKYKDLNERGIDANLFFMLGVSLGYKMSLASCIKTEYTNAFGDKYYAHSKYKQEALNAIKWLNGEGQK